MAAATGSPCALLVVEAHRRHVPKDDSLEVADVDPDLHGRGHAKHVDLIHLLYKWPFRLRFKLDNDVSEVPLPLGLVICLSSQLFGVEPQRLPQLRCFACVVVVRAKVGTRPSRRGWKPCVAVCAYPGAVKMLAGARSASPDWIYWEC